MPCFARVSEDFLFYSEMRECGKSEQNLASCDYLLVVKLVVKVDGLLLRIFTTVLFLLSLMQVLKT